MTGGMSKKSVFDDFLRKLEEEVDPSAKRRKSFRNRKNSGSLNNSREIIYNPS